MNDLEYTCDGLTRLNDRRWRFTHKRKTYYIEKLAINYNEYEKCARIEPDAVYGYFTADHGGCEALCLDDLVYLLQMRK